MAIRLGNDQPRVTSTPSPKASVAAPRAKAAPPVTSKAVGDNFGGKSKVSSKASSKLGSGGLKQVNVPSDANTAALFWKGGGEVSKGGKASKADTAKGGKATSGKATPGKATSKADTAKGGKADPYSDVAQREAFYKSGYSFDDAAAAKASFDFLGSISEAKGYIGLKVINGSEDILAEKGITPAPFDDHEEMAAFFNSDYSYDSAVQAKSKLGFLDSVADAKAYIGLKVINGSVNILEEVGVFPSSPKGKGSIYPDSGDLAEQWTGGEGSKAKGC